MNRVLLKLSTHAAIQIAGIDGGSLRNAIPRESVATIVVEKNNETVVKQLVEEMNQVLKAEYSFTDVNLALSLEKGGAAEAVLPAAFQHTFLRAMYACPNGIYRMSPDIAGLVQSSNNIAKVTLKDGAWTVQCLTRSSVDTEKTDLAQSISSAFELADGSIAFGGNYPGWTPRPEAPIVKLMSNLYQEMFNEPAHVNAVHAGLECGIIGTNYPDVQMISFGPNIYGAHSPDEKVQISSVQKFWKYFLEALQRIPVKN